MLLKDLEKIVRLVEKSEIAELEWEKNKERICIRKVATGSAQMISYAHPGMMQSAPMQTASAPAASTPAGSKETPKAETRTKEVLSPFVGTFYASASPGTPKYCDIGQRVKKGDVLCIIEAMKIMNEIEAEWPGKVTAVLVKDGQPVQYGQPIFLIEP